MHNDVSLVAVHVGYRYPRVTGKDAAVVSVTLGGENSQRILLVLLVELSVVAGQSAPFAASWERIPSVPMVLARARKVELQCDWNGMGSRVMRHRSQLVPNDTIKDILERYDDPIDLWHPMA
jgi:hypothetical protein